MFKSLKIQNIKGLHWFVIVLSITLTLIAWLVSSRQVQNNIEARFNREAEETVDQVLNRMKKYEDILWGGVATLKSHSSGFDRSEFKRFSETLNITDRYPGTNGIGVIYRVAREDLKDFVSKAKIEKPDFEIHPKHDGPILYPITYIEPELINIQALGLDMAHEQNRLDAVIRAEESRKAQITGPIVLVQDKKKSPGFLFYAPFYDVKDEAKLEGLVYAPFIFTTLMNGVLGNSDKRVDVTILDGADTLYQDKKHESLTDVFSNELKLNTKENVYGRNWLFEVSPNKSFKVSSEDKQPFWVLCAGITIDVLLFLLFLTLNRSREEAVLLAENLDRKAQAQKVRAVNAAKYASLGEMAGGIAHEINNPLAILSGNSTKMRITLSDDIFNKEKALEICDKVDETISRISKIINSMRLLSRDGSKDPFVKTSVISLLSDVVIVCKEKFKHSEVDLSFPTKISKDLKIMCRPVEVAQVLVNLLNNAYDAVFETPNAYVKLEIKEVNKKIHIIVSDSGKGIPDEVADKIMTPFFTTKDVGKGTGLGLSISKKIIENHKGLLFIDRAASSTTFVVELDLA